MWPASYTWKRICDQERLYAGPLFIHHHLHLWIDFPGIPDVYMRGKDSDYLENSRRSALV